MVPTAAEDFLFSSAGTYPLPFSMVNSNEILTLGSKLQTTKSVFKIWNPEMNFWKSPAVILSCPEIEIETDSLSTSSICRLNLICFRFKMISVTSSTTPEIVENSWSTPSILTEVIANPSSEESKTLLKAFPTVKP